MRLDEMTVDQAIALASERVPACWMSDKEYGDTGAVWNDRGYSYTRLISDDEGVYQTIVLEGPILHDVWFARAWEWLHVRDHDPDESPWFEMMGIPEEWYVGVGGAIMAMVPTKYHALVAAVLLASGKAVP